MNMMLKSFLVYRQKIERKAIPSRTEFISGVGNSP